MRFYTEYLDSKKVIKEMASMFNPDMMEWARGVLATQQTNGQKSAAEEEAAKSDSEKVHYI